MKSVNNKVSTLKCIWHHFEFSMSYSLRVGLPLCGMLIYPSATCMLFLQNICKYIRVSWSYNMFFLDLYTVPGKWNSSLWGKLPFFFLIIFLPMQSTQYTNWGFVLWLLAWGCALAFRWPICEAGMRTLELLFWKYINNAAPREYLSGRVCALRLCLKLAWQLLWSFIWWLKGWLSHGMFPIRE